MERNEMEPGFPWEKVWPEITDSRVRAAFAKVERGEFVEPQLRKWAHRDAPLPIGEGQTISQPFVVALMTQALTLGQGNKVLEIGTGSGYQTAILCELTAVSEHQAGETVYSVERYASLGRRAAAVLSTHGYLPNLRLGDGAAGWPEAAPYDAIVVTAAASCLPKPLWEQLSEGGRMVIPVGSRSGEQTLWFLTKEGMSMRKLAMGPVRFVPLVSPLLDVHGQCVDIE